jgi:type II secretory pathway pseudopilin PulG
MKRTQGFTTIEIIVAIVFLGAVGTLLFIQRGNLVAADRDSQRKASINAMYYNLEEVFFAKNGYYPATIDSAKLTAMDPELFKDPNGKQLGASDSNYRYDGVNCVNDQCKGYTLRADLEKEDDFVKTNR